MITSPPSSKEQPTQGSCLPRSILRILMLDLPLALIFAAYIAALSLEQIHTRYLSPLKDLLVWTDERREIEVTFYHYVCTPEDITASSADELVITDGMSTQDAIEHMQVHGASMYPNILSNTTADALRAFIVEENLRQEGWFVISNKNRYSFGIQVNQHPTIPKALKEIAEHAVLRPVLEQLVGRNPAVIEFTAITSTYGAEMQNYHQDVVPEGSAAKYARSFIPSYSLFIPLQDTTSAMGATEICPGTQLCGNDPQDECLEYGVSAAGSKDKWPKGWGALVNQQTSHRGTAHKDRFGPERVVFILTFAPRPQYSFPGVVESRLLGQQGSYSMQWQQWGHTLDDFGAAPDKMTEPFRTMRSLGIYKPASADWGWDLVTVALMRMANGDNGYTRDSLEEFVGKGGFAWLPKWIQAPIIEEDDEEQGPWDGGWHLFLLATFNNAKEALRLANQYVALAFVTGVSTLSIWTTLVHRSPSKGLLAFVRNSYRVAITHGTVIALAWLFMARVSSSPWAKHIESGKLFQPYRDALISDTSDFEELKLKGYTLPNQRDVLLTPHYRSKYLASYSRIVEFNQDGNRIWNDLVTKHSHGFTGLTPGLQRQLCDNLVKDTMLAKHRGRLLQQTEAGRWSVLPEEDAHAFCFEELTRSQNPLVRALLNEVDHLQTEIEFGAWRNMAIHQSVILSYLNFWSNRILGLVLPEVTKPVIQMPLLKRSLTVRHPLSIGPTIPLIGKAPSRITKGPSPLIVRPPFQNAWFTTGDVVEGMYGGAHEEWYRGVVIDVSADQGTFDVVYDDGEEDYGLCRFCVRPFKPYQVGAFAEARVDDFTYEKVEIVAAHDDGTFAITFLNDYTERIFERIPASSLRRFA